MRYQYWERDKWSHWGLSPRLYNKIIKSHIHRPVPDGSRTRVFISHTWRLRNRWSIIDQKSSCKILLHFSSAPPFSFDYRWGVKKDTINVLEGLFHMENVKTLIQCWSQYLSGVSYMILNSIGTQGNLKFENLTAIKHVISKKTKYNTGNILPSNIF